MRNPLARMIAGGKVPEVLPSADEIVADRLAPLVYARLESSSDRGELREALRPHVLRAVASDLAQTRALLELWDLATGLKLLVMKGAAMGPLLYTDSAMRPREDIDVWVDGWSAARALADRLSAAGYAEVHQLPGRTARHAIAMRRGRGECIDVHAACSRRVRVARALPFDTAWGRRAELNVEGVTMTTLADEHAWLIAATHLTAHHAGQHPPRVLVEDLRRLGARLRRDEWTAIWGIGIDHGLLSALKSAVDELNRWDPTALPADFVDAVADASHDESSRFVQPVGRLLDDLELLSADDAIEYLGELLYPPADYLHDHYGLANRRPRSLLAGHRLLRGAVARCSSRGHNRDV